MKSKLYNSVCVPAMLALLTVNSELSTARGQGTAFTYQGSLSSNGVPANGYFDFEFSLYPNAEGTGTQIGSTITQTNMGVTNGLFTATLGFGNVFTGNDTWLEISVRSNGVGGYTALTPLQELTPTPYAVFANTSSNLSGTVQGAQLSGTYSSAVTFDNPGNSFTGSGSGLTNLNASKLTLGTLPDTLLSTNVPLLDGTQTFTGVNTFSGANQGLIVNGGPIGTNLFTGLGLQYNPGSGEGAIISSLTDNRSFLTFYTKEGTGVPPVQQMKIDRNGVVMIDDQADNNGVLNDNTTNGAGLVFGGDSGEGIASQRTAGVNKNGLDLYTSNNRRMSILNNGNIGIGTTNPVTVLDVNGTITAAAFSGDGVGLTNLSASKLASGTIPLAQLPGPVVTNTEIGVTLAGTFTGDGAGLTTLNASQLTSGAIPLARLPAVVVTNNEPSVTLGSLTLDGNLNLPAPAAISSGGVSLLYADNAEDFFAGQAAGNAHLTGGNNTAEGYEALAHVTAGAYNTANGANALLANKGGDANTANGYLALWSNGKGNNNTAIGANAMAFNTSGNNNTAMGVSALENSTNDNDLVAIGYQALQNDNAYPAYTYSTNGENTAIGYQALQADTVGYGNTAVGFGTLLNNTIGEGNTAVGDDALSGIEIGTNNIAIGVGAGSAIGSGSFNIDIGNEGEPGDSFAIRIGLEQGPVDTYIAGIYENPIISGSPVPVIVDENGRLGTMPSSERFKENICSMDDASEALLSLRPVTFQYKSEVDRHKTPQFGLVAEEVEKVNPALVAHDAQGKPFTVRYDAVNAMLLNEFLKQHKKVEEQSTEIETLREKAEKVDSLQKQNDSLAERLNDLEATVRELSARK